MEASGGGNLGFALLLTLAAGLATGVGSVAALVLRHPGPRFMSFTLGFSAGVMILVSFVELLAAATRAVGFAQAHLAFFAGILAIMAIDYAVPHAYLAEQAGAAGGSPRQATLARTGLLTALGIAIHNFPEGMATLSAALEDTRLGVATAAAIAIHNIPEGLAVAVPIQAATGSRGRAFVWSFLSGLAEPVGAGAAVLLLRPPVSAEALGWMLAAVAGLMVFISLDELVPASRSFGHENLSIFGVVAGMAVMATSLGLLGLK